MSQVRHLSLHSGWQAPPSQTRSAGQLIPSQGETQLPEIKVRGAATGETAYGPVEGYNATRSATGTKTDTPLIEIPQTVTVVTADQMRDQGVQGLQDALRYVAGVMPDPQGTWGFDIFNIRGFSQNDAVFRDGLRLVRREWPTDIGPVDLMCRDPDGEWVAVEIKRVGTIEAVEQLSRYLEVLRRDPALASCRGILAAESVKPQARTLCTARGLGCVEVDLHALRGAREPELTLFEA